MFVHVDMNYFTVDITMLFLVAIFYQSIATSQFKLPVDYTDPAKL